MGIDEETLELREVEVTTSNVGDAPMLPGLHDQIPQGQAIGSSTADGAFNTRKMQSMPRVISAVPSGKGGADTTAGAASKPKCMASN